jgi:hypothetical protein
MVWKLIFGISVDATSFKFKELQAAISDVNIGGGDSSIIEEKNFGICNEID